MSSLHTTPHTLHMSPAQAAQTANVSRWTILRAIKSQHLKARRDNRNNWQINPEDLEEWCAHSVHAPQFALPATDAAQSDEMLVLRAALTAETARANAAERARDQAEADRDQWREMAQALAKRHNFKWPWQR